MLSTRTCFSSVALKWPNLDKTKRASETRAPLCKETHDIPETHPWGDCDFCQICLPLREKHQQIENPSRTAYFQSYLKQNQW